MFLLLPYPTHRFRVATAVATLIRFRNDRVIVAEARTRPAVGGSIVRESGIRRGVGREAANDAPKTGVQPSHADRPNFYARNHARFPWWTPPFRHPLVTAKDRDLPFDVVQMSHGFCTRSRRSTTNPWPGQGIGRDIGDFGLTLHTTTSSGRSRAERGTASITGVPLRVSEHNKDGLSQRQSDESCFGTLVDHREDLQPLADQ